MKDATKKFKARTSQFAEVLSKNKILMDLLEIQSFGKVAWSRPSFGGDSKSENSLRG